MSRDLIEVYVGGILIGTGVSDRSGDIMNHRGVFFDTTTEFFTYTVTEWHARKRTPSQHSTTTIIARLGLGFRG